MLSVDPSIVLSSSGGESFQVAFADQAAVMSSILTASHAVRWFPVPSLSFSARLALSLTFRASNSVRTMRVFSELFAVLGQTMVNVP